MIIKLSRDINGNKTAKVIFLNGDRGFSVRTFGNMPKTHKMTKDDNSQFIMINELNAFIKNYGTKRQKQLLGWY